MGNFIENHIEKSRKRLDNHIENSRERLDDHISRAEKRYAGSENQDSEPKLNETAEEL